MNRWEILAVDDSGRFPLHVWRYVTGCLGYGVGEVGWDGLWRGLSDGQEQAWIDSKPLRTDDGCHRLWWVHADEGATARLSEVFGSLGEESRVCVLVDVQGRRGSGYRIADVVAHVQEEGGRFLDCKIYPVSAYYSDYRIGRPVLPKSRETLRHILRELGIRRAPPKAPPGVRHILVTGAGFEIRGDRGGFGMPPTRELLSEMGHPQGPLDLGLASMGDNDFPVPTLGIWDTFAVRRPLEKFAEKKDLDFYWDYLLEQELSHKLGSHFLFTPEERDKTKDEALRRERFLREAFRRSLLRHDWGHMNQSLDAAQLPLHAWLTTNYTRFADRAISLFDDSDERLGMWRIISTAAEARTLTRHGLGAPDQKVRYLFKLHGDISHLQTMAIAGHDKDRFSPLTMPVDDLYEIYAAAERFLIDSLRSAGPGLVVWHIVGHGLQDRRLCALISWVCSHLPDRTSQVFVIANPHPLAAVDDLGTSLDEARPGSRQAVHACELKAAEYMARLLQLLRGNEEGFEDVRSAETFLRWLGP